MSDGPIPTPDGAVPQLAYFDLILDDFDAGRATRHAHLGHWDDPGAMPETIGEVQAAQRHAAKLLVDLLDVGSGQVVLDVGCGLGGSVELITELRPDAQVIGLNIDPRQLARCRTVAAPATGSVDWLRADALGIPLGAATVDRVLCLEALPHFASRAGFFQEASRVLRPGGRVVVTDLLVRPEAPDALGIAPAELARRLHEELGPWPDAAAQRQDVVDVAAAAGLRCTTWIDATRATNPSHALSFAGVEPGVPTPWDAILEAERLFSWLHERSLIECHYLAFALDH